MGVGKTATARELQQLLPHCVFLDGDWCWDASPFIVTEETKRMVLKNITLLLRNFLACSAYENIVFCWVMHEQSIMDEILAALSTHAYCLHIFSLVCTEADLISRIQKDIDNGIRKEDVLPRSISRIGGYYKMNTTKIDVSELSAIEAAKFIYQQLYSGG